MSCCIKLPDLNFSKKSLLNNQVYVSQTKIDDPGFFMYYLTVSIKRLGLDFLEKVSIKRPVLSFFQILEVENDQVL